VNRRPVTNGLVLVLTGCGDEPVKADPMACRAVMEKRFVENTADGTVPSECKGVDAKDLEDEPGGMKVTVGDPPSPRP
jgi:hypothetical protein